MKCRVCSKIYNDRNHLEEHEDIHITGRKHYSCGEKLQDGTLCFARYSRKCSIRLYMMNVHKKKLAKSLYSRKPDDQLRYQMLEEYEKQVQEKNRGSGHVYSTVRGGWGLYLFHSKQVHVCFFKGYRVGFYIYMQGG